MTKPSFSLRLRRWKLGLKTLFGKEPAGYFIPYRYAAQTRSVVGRPTYPYIQTLMEHAVPNMMDMLSRLDAYRDEFSSFENALPPEPRWQQAWFPRLDGMMAYVMTRTKSPKRIIEIGSGHSTRFYHRAIRDGNLDCSFHAIDPSPRADIAQLPISIDRVIVQQAEIEKFKQLQAGDILSIDSSHILMPGTDVDLLFSSIIPILPSGTFIHIHDITLPDDYPEIWQWRGYNEQQGVAALLATGGLDILWSSHFATTRLGQELDKTIAAQTFIPKNAFETSLWLQKK